MSDKKSELAFPFKCQGPTTAPEIYYGMTLRDYFAAKWMQGYMANSALDDMTVDLAACKAYQMADAMLKAREE
jgi:hypothetical protein